MRHSTKVINLLLIFKFFNIERCLIAYSGKIVRKICNFLQYFSWVKLEIFLTPVDLFHEGLILWFLVSVDLSTWKYVSSAFWKNRQQLSVNGWMWSLNDICGQSTHPQCDVIIKLRSVDRFWWPEMTVMNLLIKDWFYDFKLKCWGKLVMWHKWTYFF